MYPDMLLRSMRPAGLARSTMMRSDDVENRVFPWPCGGGARTSSVSCVTDELGDRCHGGQTVDEYVLASVMAAAERMADEGGTNLT